MPQEFAIDDIVDLTKWDRSERPINRLGQCRITKMRQARSESGWLCDVESIAYTGRKHFGLDQHWFRLIQRGKAFSALPSNEQVELDSALKIRSGA